MQRWIYLEGPNLNFARVSNSLYTALIISNCYQAVVQLCVYITFSEDLTVKTLKTVLRSFFSFFLKKIAGDEYVGFNNSVFLSERETADRNFAMAYYMRENKCFPPATNLQDCMDLYFQVNITLTLRAVQRTLGA